MSDTVWICIRNLAVESPLIEMMGVFTSEEAARAVCSRVGDCIGPMELDVRQPEEPRIWPGAYYPLAEVLDEGDS